MAFFVPQTLVDLIFKNSLVDLHKPDIIIVLGGGISKEGILPQWVEERLDHAAKLYVDQKLPKLLMSGKGRDNFPIAEADAMKAYLVAKGLSATDILTETLSTDTLQNAFFCKTMHLDPLNLSDILVITNQFHIKRTRQIFEFVLGTDYHLSYQSVSDHNLDTEQLKLREFTEGELIKFYQRLFASVSSDKKKGLHSFIYKKQDPFHQEYIRLSERLGHKMVLY